MVFCLLVFLTLNSMTANGAVTKKCHIEEIPKKIESYLDISPHLRAREKSGKWVALDHVITKTNVVAAYECISKEIFDTYKNSDSRVTLNFRNWLKVNKVSFYAPANDFGWGNIFVNKIAEKYKINKYISDFNKGSIIVKESFVFDVNGYISVGPLFYMVKMEEGFNLASNDWKFVEVNNDGSLIETNHSDPKATKRCIKCHGKRKNTDFLYFIKSE
ncbi:cytochrome P460 family protein [Alphaproteobacteria bacterium]|nr:cytochrome P460 family protein [Alphaproteobacteria bacterium]